MELLTAPAIAAPALVGTDPLYILYVALGIAGMLFALAAGVQALWRYVRAKR